jgi:hypothetical protein
MPTARMFDPVSFVIARRDRAIDYAAPSGMTG